MNRVEVEITGGHWSFSVSLIRMTDRFYAWLVGVTDHSIGVRLERRSETQARGSQEATCGLHGTGRLVAGV